MVALALVIPLVARSRATGRRTALLIGAAAVATVMSVVTVITRSLVEWDQLALRSVTVGSDIDGYWTAAFGDDVRFVLLGSIEVSQGAYGVVLVAHLTAPALAAAALLVLGMALVRRREDDEVTSEAMLLLLRDGRVIEAQLATIAGDLRDDFPWSLLVPLAVLSRRGGPVIDPVRPPRRPPRDRRRPPVRVTPAFRRRARADDHRHRGRRPSGGTSHPAARRELRPGS